MVALWSLRLGAHILVRTREAGDDPRYRELISQWGAHADLRMFLQLQSQAAVGLILALSVSLAAHNTRPSLGLSDFLGLALLVGALAGEAVSDWQLRRFRSDTANHGRICEAGLWSLSRHPSYFFFEWLCWLAYPLIAIDVSGHNPLGWLTRRRPACTGCWCMSPAFHRWRSTCCARAAQNFGPCKRARGRFFLSPKRSSGVRPPAWSSARSPLWPQLRRATFPNPHRVM